MADRQPNPYRPGFNQPPPVLAGREQLLESANEALETAAYDGHTPRPLVLVGPRGVGKTVLLGEIAAVAQERFSWPAIHLEATVSRPLTRALAARLVDVATLLDGQAPRRRPTRKPRTRISGGSVSAAAFGVGAEVRVERPPADDEGSHLDLDDELARAAEVAIGRDSGILVAIDELHTASREDVNELAAALQVHAPAGWPIVVVLAGLPSLRTITRRQRNRPPTYLERAEWHEVGALDPVAARRALVEPAEQAGRPMDRGAADDLLVLAGGYPYAVQVAGHFAWRASHGRQRISRRHAAAAAPRIRADLEQLFISRWEDASAREREYLQALADASGENAAPRGGDVAARLGSATTAVSYLRDRLMKKGTIWSDAGGGLHFITPGMGDWVRATRSGPTT